MTSGSVGVLKLQEKWQRCDILQCLISLHRSLIALLHMLKNVDLQIFILFVSIWYNTVGMK